MNMQTAEQELKAIIALDRIPENAGIEIKKPQWVNLIDKKLIFASDADVIGIPDVINNPDGGRSIYKVASVVIQSTTTILFDFEYREKRWTGLRADVIINGQSVDVEDFCDEDMPKWASQLDVD